MRHKGSRAETAKELNMSLSTIRRKIIKYGIK